MSDGGKGESTREWCLGGMGFMDSWMVISAEKTLVQVTMLIYRIVPSLELSHDLQQLDNTALSVLSLPRISALNCDGGDVSGEVS